MTDLRQGVLNGLIDAAETHFRHGLQGPDADTERVRDLALRGLLESGAESLIAAWETLLPRLRTCCSGLNGAVERLQPAGVNGTSLSQFADAPEPSGGDSAEMLLCDQGQD